MTEKTDREIIEAATKFFPLTYTDDDEKSLWNRKTAVIGRYNERIGSCVLLSLNTHLDGYEALGEFITAGSTRWPAAVDKLDRLIGACEQHRKDVRDQYGGSEQPFEELDQKLWRVLDEVKKP